MRAFTAFAAAIFLATVVIAGDDDWIENPDNPADLVNCPPNGGADACSKETSCGDRIRLNYGWQVKDHYVWYISNYDPNNLPQGIKITTDTKGTCN
ncbi:hypothetical protein HDZ31DRAFT_70421 [Schizophyllum fasciatum]